MKFLIALLCALTLSASCTKRKSQSTEESSDKALKFAPDSDKKLKVNAPVHGTLIMPGLELAASESNTSTTISYDAICKSCSEMIGALQEFANKTSKEPLNKSLSSHINEGISMGIKLCTNAKRILLITEAIEDQINYPSMDMEGEPVEKYNSENLITALGDLREKMNSYSNQLDPIQGEALGAMEKACSK